MAQRRNLSENEKYAAKIRRVERKMQIMAPFYQALFNHPLLKTIDEDILEETINGSIEEQRKVFLEDEVELKRSYTRLRIVVKRLIEDNLDETAQQLYIVLKGNEEPKARA
jgi:hypothetical protein